MWKCIIIIILYMYIHVMIYSIFKNNVLFLIVEKVVFMIIYYTAQRCVLCKDHISCKGPYLDTLFHLQMLKQTIVILLMSSAHYY